MLSIRNTLQLLLSVLALQIAQDVPAFTTSGTLETSGGMVLIPGGTFLMGTEDGFPYESPVHEVEVEPFWMDRTEVTVGEFEAFVQATGYKTESEKLGWSGVFDLDKGEWTKSDGADWRHPEGPGTTADTREPVVHVSYADAVAFATWAAKRLPTEAEWEFAARGGLKEQRYPWGNELLPEGKPVANWWQGHFPDENTREDGFGRRAPVASFPPNPYGLHDVAGNVWEWCADWFDEDFYRSSPRRNPKGAAIGEERVIRGGAWLCSINYCQGYRVAARGKTAPDSGLNNTGFRCARSYTKN